MKTCSNCGQSCPDDAIICPICGAEFESVPGQSNINMGNANAISGDIHSTDDHSSHDSNNQLNSNNASNSYNTTNNTTIHEAQKSESTLLNENKMAYRLKCKELFEDGHMIGNGESQLRELQVSLNLADEIALPIKEEIRLQSKKRKKQLPLGGKQEINQTKTIIEQNVTSALQRQLVKLEQWMQEYDDDSLKSVYYQMASMLEPVRYTNRYEDSAKDEYWEAYWAYIAYMLQTRFKEADEALASLGRWHAHYPEQNDVILFLAGQLMQNDSLESAQKVRGTLPAHYSPNLQLLLDAMDELLQKDYEKEFVSIRPVHAFYINSLFTEFFDTQKANGLQRIEDAKIRKAQEEQIERDRLHEQELARQAAAKAQADADAESARLAALQQDAENIAKAQDLANQQQETEAAAAARAKAEAERIEQERLAAEEEELRRREEEKRRRKAARIAWLERNFWYIAGGIIGIVLIAFLSTWVPKKVKSKEAEKESQRIELDNYELLISTCKNNIALSTTDNLVPLDSAAHQLVRIKRECKRLEQDATKVKQLDEQFVTKARALENTLKTLADHPLNTEQAIGCSEKCINIESWINFIDQ